jgi:hypothetical protein
MATATDHNAVLGKVARARLEPLGLIQKGRSRTWFDDHAWFVTTVEFQASAHAKGSYLNVGASWLWWPGKASVSFDEGYRVEGLKLADEGDWEATCGVLADEAARRCLEVRREFPNIRTTAARLNRSKAGHSAGAWAMADAGVAAALAGDAALARRRLNGISEAEVAYDWERERRAVALRLLDELGDLDRFRDARIADIQRARERERLPTLGDEAIRAALMSPPPHGKGRPLPFATALGGFRKRG